MMAPAFCASSLELKGVLERLQSHGLISARALKWMAAKKGSSCTQGFDELNNDIGTGGY